MKPFSIHNKAAQHKTLRRLYRAVAWTLCVCLFLTDVAQAAPMERRSSPVARDSKTKLDTALTDNNIAVKMPQQFGTVEEVYASPRSASDGRRATVYYIQDAHDSLEAQENIAKIIHYLVEHSGVKTVFEEGYEGVVPTEKYFAGIKDAQVKRKVAYSLMNKLLIGGAEYAHITRFSPVARRSSSVDSKKDISLRTTRDERRDFSLIGADNVQLHLENIEWYRQAAMTRKATDADLQDLAARLQVLAERELPKEVKEWMKLRKRFDDGELDLIEYIKRLVVIRSVGAILSKQLAGRHELPLPDTVYPHISTVLQAEQTRTPESLKEVQNLSYRELFAEIDRFENEFAKQALQNQKRQAIFHYRKILNQLLRLSALEISFEEYEAIKSVLKTFKTEELLSFIAHETHRSLALSKKWEENIKRAMRFYELAEERDAAVEKALKKFQLRGGRVKLEETLSAALVFGGFHKENIKEIMRRNRFSYVVIAPKISKINTKQQSLYRKLMSHGVQGSSLISVARLATRYAPIFEMGEYLGQRDLVMALIKSEANKASVRSEVRSKKDKGSDKAQALLWLRQMQEKIQSPEYVSLKKLDKRDGVRTRISRSWALLFFFLMLIQNSGLLVQHPERLIYLSGGLVLSGVLGNLFMPKNLRTGGLFGVIQHPIYLLKIVTLLAMFVHLPTFASAGLFVTLGAWVAWRMYFEYEKLKFEYGEAYKAYWERTPLIVPFTLWLRPFWKKPVQTLQRWLQPTPIERMPEQILTTEQIQIDETQLIEDPYDFFRAVKHSAVWGWYGKSVFDFPLTVMEHRFLGWLAITFGTTLGITEIRGVLAGDLWSAIRLAFLPGAMWFLSFLHFREWRRARFIYQKALRYDKAAPQIWQKNRLERAKQFENETGWKIDWTSDPLALAVMRHETKRVAMTVGWLMPDLTSDEGRSANSYFSHTLRLMQAAIEKENEELETKNGKSLSEIRSINDSLQGKETYPSFQFPTRKVERTLRKFQKDFPPGVLEEVMELFDQTRGKSLTLQALKQRFPEPVEAAQKRIVFTGGPYGGKTTFLKKITDHYKEEAVSIPEVIGILKDAGIDLKTLQGQRIVYALKYLLELAAARVYPDRLIFLDRGTLDGAAYWPEGREAFFSEIGGQRSELERYGAVIQMQSVVTTKHADDEYRGRVESADRAVEIEQELETVWRNHGRYYFVPHREWSKKTREAEQIITFLKSRLLDGAKAPLVFDFEHQGLHYHYPNIAAYDFDPKTLDSFLNRSADAGAQVPLVMDLHFKAPCGLRCIFCYTEGGVTDERHAIDEQKYGVMEPEDIRNAIRQYAALGGHTLILLSIGEPLTNVNLFIEYAELAQQLGVRVVTFTNMLLITPEVAKRLRQADVNMLLKLNHLDPALNNQLAGREKPYKYVEYQGQKIPQQLVNILEAYQDRPDLLAISSDITRLNADNILEISRWAYETLGVAHFRKHLYYFGFAQANRDLLVLSDEEALAFDKKVYEFDREYGYQYPAPDRFTDQYSFDMRRFLNNNVNISGFPVRTFAHYLSGIYHSSERVQPKYGYKKGIKIALKRPEAGKVDVEEFFRLIFRHILFFKGVHERLEKIETSFQSDRERQLDHIQSQVSRQQRWDEAYRLTGDIKKYLAEYGADLAVADRRRLRRFLKRATELARENVLYWVPKKPGLTIIGNDQLRTAYPGGEKFQFFSLEGASVFYTDPYQVTYSIVPPGHEQAIHGHFFTRELSLALDPGLGFHLFRIQNGVITQKEAYTVPEFSGAAFGIRTPHSLFNLTEQSIRNMTVKYGIQVTDRWDLKEAPAEDTFTFEGGVKDPHVEKVGGATLYSFDKGDLYHRVVVLKPGDVYPYELATDADKGWFVVEGKANVSGPIFGVQDVLAEKGSIVYAKGSDKPGRVLFENDGQERLVIASVDLKESLFGRFQEALARTYHALITDVDGVLTDPATGKVSEQALEFLVEKINQGTPMMIISGRNEFAFGQGYRKQAPSLEEVAARLRLRLGAEGNEKALENVFFASENGVVISNGFKNGDPRRINYPTGFEKQEITRADQTHMIDHLKALGLVDENVLIENKSHGFVVKDTFGTRVTEIAVEIQKELSKRGLTDTFEILSSEEDGTVYVYPRGSNKRRGLDFMLQNFGFKPAEVAAFADRGGMGELDHELLEGAAGFSTDTVAENGKTVNLRALSGFLPGAQSFVWAAEQLKFFRPNDLPQVSSGNTEIPLAPEARSEMRVSLEDAKSQAVLKQLETMEKALVKKKEYDFWRRAKQLDRQHVAWAVVGDESALEGWEGAQRPKVFGRLNRKEVLKHFLGAIAIPPLAKRRVTRTLEAHMLDIPEGNVNILIARKIKRKGQAYLHISRSESAGTLAKSLFYYMIYGYMDAISLTSQFDALVPLPNSQGGQEAKVDTLRGGSYSSIKRIVNPDGSSVIVKRASTDKDKGKLRREAEYMRSLQAAHDAAGAYFPKIYSITMEGGDTVVMMEDVVWPSLSDIFKMTNLSGQTGLLPEPVSQQNRFQMSQKIYRALTPVFYARKQSETPPDFLERFHFQKVEDRWNEAEARSPLLKELFAAPYLEVHPSLGGMIKTLPNLKTALSLLRLISRQNPELFTPPYLSKQHGDSHFGNILMDPFSFLAEGDDENFKLVDPKHIPEGNDPLYDFAKLMHNYYGHYDLALNLSGTYHFAIRLPKTPGAPAQLEESFYDEHSAAARMMEASKAYERDVRHFLRDPDPSLFPFEKADGFWKYRLLFTHATLMAGLLPFHAAGDSHESKDGILYERTAELFYELIKKLWQDGWMDSDPELKQKVAGLWTTAYGDQAGYLQKVNDIDHYLGNTQRSEVRTSSIPAQQDRLLALQQLEERLFQTEERGIEKIAVRVKATAQVVLKGRDGDAFISEVEPSVRAWALQNGKQYAQRLIAILKETAEQPEERLQSYLKSRVVSEEEIALANRVRKVVTLNELNTIAHRVLSERQGTPPFRQHAYNVLGIFFFGSLVNSSLTPQSDLDYQLIVKDRLDPERHILDYNEHFTKAVRAFLRVNDIPEDAVALNPAHFGRVTSEEHQANIIGQRAPLTRSEMRSKIHSRQVHFQPTPAIRDMTTPAAVFLDAGELARVADNDSEKRFEELLALLSQYKKLDLYLDGTDRYPVESIKSPRFQKLLSEYSDRIHISLFDRARLAQKKIVIDASLFEKNESAEATQEKMNHLKEHYQISGDVLPLEYTKPGALKAFLGLAELGTAAELVRKISDFYAVRGLNGRWQVGEAYLADVWSNLAANTAVAWAA